MERRVETALRTASQQLWEGIRTDPDVHACGVGMRRRKGQRTDEPVVAVVVTKKRPESQLSRSRILPKTVVVEGEEWGVDVIEGGPFKTGSVAAAEPVEQDPNTPFPVYPDRMRPPRQGASISNLYDGQVAGTLGCYVVDNTDGSICLLTCNHVIVRGGAGSVGDPILQPGGYDGGDSGDEIGALKRWAPLVDNTNVDAAIASLNTPSAYTTATAGDALLPISRTHPAVGMAVAGDAIGNGMLTRMDATCAALDVYPLVGAPPGTTVGASAGLIAPRVGMMVHKVGRTSGYTSVPIEYVGLSADVVVSTTGTVLTYTDLIYVAFFIAAGDSGSVVCRGDDDWVIITRQYYAALMLLVCQLLGSLEAYYAIPLTDDQELEDKLRDDFLMKSAVGRLLISTTYINQAAAQQRLTDMEGSLGQSMEQSNAASLYAKYHDLVEGILTDPNATDVVTQENLDDIFFIISGEHDAGMLTYEEYVALYTIYTDLLSQTLGKNREQVIDLFNLPESVDIVYQALVPVPTVELHDSAELFKAR